MVKNFSGLLSFFLPPAECLLCLRLIEDGVLCDACRGDLPSHVGEQLWRRRALGKRCRKSDMAIATLWRYAWPLSAVQHRCKFGRWQLGGKMFAAYAAGCFAAVNMDMQGFVLVPSPMHWRRRVQRGGNHALWQGEQFAKVLGIPCKPSWLQRVKARPQQVGLSRSQRLKNLRRVFVASPQVTGRKVLLFDDIVTTGTTMRYMAEALYAKDAELVVGVSLMRVD